MRLFGALKMQRNMCLILFIDQNPSILLTPLCPLAKTEQKHDNSRLSD